MKNLQRGFIIPLIIAIVILLAIGGGIYYSKNKKASAPSDWKSYTDTKYNFRLAHPDGYTTRQYYDGKCSTVIAWMDGYFENDSLRKSSLEENKIIDFNAIINDPNDNCVRSHYSSPSGAGAKKLIDSKEIVVNGYKVLQRNYVDDLLGVEGKPFEFSTFRFQSGNTYVTLLINNGVTSDPGTVNNKNLLDQFVKNFSFLN